MGMHNENLNDYFAVFDKLAIRMQFFRGETRRYNEN